MRARSCPPHYRLRAVPRRREKHSSPPSISSSLSVFLPYSFSLSFSSSPFPLVPLPFAPNILVPQSFLLSFALVSRASLSRSRALRELSGCAMFNLHPAVPSPSVSVPCFENRQKEVEKVSLIPRAFFRALEKVGVAFLARVRCFPPQC